MTTTRERIKLARWRQSAAAPVSPSPWFRGSEPVGSERSKIGSTSAG